MTPLPEVAADVAKALKLTDESDAAWWSGADYLEKDGSNIGAAPWFRACCEWLHSQRGRTLCFSWILTSDGKPFQKADYEGFGVYVTVECSIFEAPARLVSAVWRATRSKE